MRFLIKRYFNKNYVLIDKHNILFIKDIISWIYQSILF